MRRLGQNGTIAYVTASGHPLKWLCTAGNFASPFYNIFSHVPLKHFRPEETSEFLAANRVDVAFSKKEIDFIKRIAGNYPLHLQIACYHVFEEKGKEGDEKKLRQDIEREIKRFEDKWARRGRGIVKHGKALP